jgi:hypothetical protein
MTEISSALTGVSSIEQLDDCSAVTNTLMFSAEELSEINR